uniref:Uncharacterized protein n=1 Tax=Erwinia amylovora ATCC BAA-2158 TaxID=889211 RepID=E5B3M2_ERWAM|nr:hypothetical protein predicted by Glimmer/Critica [Erwinia amylovora ATCC BAA-2158]
MPVNAVSDGYDVLLTELLHPRLASQICLVQCLP